MAENNNNFQRKRTNPVTEQIPEDLPEVGLTEFNQAEASNFAKEFVADYKQNIGNEPIDVPNPKKAEEEKNHLTAWASQIQNLDENEAMIAAKIMADKYPDILYKALMEQMYDLMKSRDEVNASLNQYFGKRNDIFNK